MGNGDKPAMPIVDELGNCSHEDWATKEMHCSGVSKRELFAAMAMQGMLSGVFANQNALDTLFIKYEASGEEPADNIAGQAVEYAEALLTALEDNNGKA